MAWWNPFDDDEVKWYNPASWRNAFDADTKVALGASETFKGTLEVLNLLNGIQRR